MTNSICEYHLWYLLFTLYKTRQMSSEYHVTFTFTFDLDIMDLGEEAISCNFQRQLE
jgi:hypothetical protein